MKQESKVHDSKDQVKESQAEVAKRIESLSEQMKTLMPHLTNGQELLSKVYGQVDVLIEDISQSKVHMEDLTESLQKNQ